ncbi:DsbA family oxidoreductase [Ramlibacter sp. MMS24-I3-19]|uniref:DsbA family oxidoreductase n=1 Tax=Ramlibacter sp. MMS24-I3-19 TaxID=3416606 RepID=UPI003D06F577
MTATLKIDFVSDVACPWCAVGLGSLEQALRELDGEITAELRFQPFELNPHMGPEGQDATEHLAQKYGSSPEQQAANWEALRQRAAAVGVPFKREGRRRVWNTFDAHRLLHWAGEINLRAQLALKKALLHAYFGEGRGLADHQVLLDAAEAAGLDVEQARTILAGDTYATEVRERERFYTSQGIHAVPSVIVNERHLIQGGQPPEVFARALRQIAAEEAPA